MVNTVASQQRDGVTLQVNMPMRIALVTPSAVGGYVGLIRSL